MICWVLTTSHAYSLLPANYPPGPHSPWLQRPSQRVPASHKSSYPQSFIPSRLWASAFTLAALLPQCSACDVCTGPLHWLFTVPRALSPREPVRSTLNSYQILFLPTLPLTFPAPTSMVSISVSTSYSHQHMLFSWVLFLVSALDSFLLRSSLRVLSIGALVCSIGLVGHHTVSWPLDRVTNYQQQ